MSKAQSTSQHVGRSSKIPFHSIRNITSPEDLENDRKVYVGQIPVFSIIGLSTEENVRSYLVEAEGKVRRRPSQVHRAIETTLENSPEIFSVLNSGVVVVADECEIDDKEKILILTDASIINGSQTQGVISDFHDKLKSTGSLENYEEPHLKLEVVVTKDKTLVAEISIARNYQNDVMTISIAGRLGQLDELQKSIRSERRGAKLQSSETELSDDYIKTERLLQVITALIPEELWVGKEFNKVYTYSMKAKCLKDFQEIYRRAKDKTDSEHIRYKELYQFYLDIAPDALDLYEKWKVHQGFAGTGIRSIQREGKEIIEVPDGIIFPILAAHSVFASKKKEKWAINVPEEDVDNELISSAKSALMEIAHHNPWNMGKSRACYASLLQISSIYRRLSKN